MASRASHIVRCARTFTSLPLKGVRTVSRPQWQNRAVASHMQQRARGFSVLAALREKKYTEDHEWIEEQDKGIFTLGISSYAAEQLGDVVYIELPSLSLAVASGEAIGAVESVKSASDILTPISGEVVEVNSTLEEKPGHINKEPEGSAWIAKIKVEDGYDVNSGEVKLLSVKEYKALTETASEGEK